MPTVSDVHGSSANAQACQQCQHSWDAHVMHPAQYPYPTDGWITCPVPGCACHGTWSVDEESRPAMEKYRADFIANGGTVTFAERMPNER